MTELETLIRMVSQGFDRKSWHGPNLMGTLRGVAATTAAWRVAPERHNIREHVVHAAYWKYSVARRIVGAERGSFGERGSNWFVRPESDDELGWRADLRLLKRHHAELVAAISSLPESRLDEIPAGSATTLRDLIIGVAMHDVHHAAQIALIKRLATDAAPSPRATRQPRRRS